MKQRMILESHSNSLLRSFLLGSAFFVMGYSFHAEASDSDLQNCVKVVTEKLGSNSVSRKPYSLWELLSMPSSVFDSKDSETALSEEEKAIVRQLPSRYVYRSQRVRGLSSSSQEFFELLEGFRNKSATPGAPTSRNDIRDALVVSEALDRHEILAPVVVESTFSAGSDLPRFSRVRAVVPGPGTAKITRAYTIISPLRSNGHFSKTDAERYAGVIKSEFEKGNHLLLDHTFVSDSEFQQLMTKLEQIEEGLEQKVRQHSIIVSLAHEIPWPAPVPAKKMVAKQSK